MDLDLAQVRAFVAVIDHGHFGRAALTLTLSQQALSKRVARLESQLGPLLERRRMGVTPTPAGHRFLPAARRMLELADHAVADVRRAPPASLRVDVWGDAHPPAALMRSIAREQAELFVELSMRRDLVEALTALQRHDIELAFGNVTGLAHPLPPDLTAELITTEPIAVLVNAHGALADRDVLRATELARHGLWWPIPGSSEELRAFATEYARSVGAELATYGTNLGIDALVEHVAGDPAVVSPVGATWPLHDRDGVKVIPLRPTPHYPWHAVWRTASAHPSLPPVLRALRARRSHSPEAGSAWLPRGLRPRGDAASASRPAD